MLSLGCVELKSTKNNTSNLTLGLLDVCSPYLKEVHFDSTSQCNLLKMCGMCYQSPYLGRTEFDLTTDEIKYVVDQLRDMNVARLVLSGGEPFMRGDLLDIIKYVISKSIVVSTIFTNGTVHKLDILREICRLQKPITLAVSLDGFTPVSNDFIRGRGSFNMAMQFIMYVLAERSMGSQVRLVIDTMIHPLNYLGLKDFFIFLSKLGVDRWRIALPRDQGAYANNRTKLWVDSEKVFTEYERFISWYLSEGRKISQLDIQVESFFRTALLQGRQPQVFTPDSCCCEYKRQAMTIKPNGDVTACTAFTNLVLGNIRQSSVAELWYLVRMQELKQMKVSTVQECVGCKYLYLCGTGCRTMALRETGSLTRKDVAACGVYKFFHHRLLPLLWPHLV